jgi:hypothetical protein
MQIRNGSPSKQASKQAIQLDCGSPLTTPVTRASLKNSVSMIGFICPPAGAGTESTLIRCRTFQCEREGAEKKEISHRQGDGGGAWR